MYGGKHDLENFSLFRVQGKKRLGELFSPRVREYSITLINFRDSLFFFFNVNVSNNTEIQRHTSSTSSTSSISSSDSQKIFSTMQDLGWHTYFKKTNHSTDQIIYLQTVANTINSLVTNYRIFEKDISTSARWETATQWNSIVTQWKRESNQRGVGT